MLGEARNAVPVPIGVAGQLGDGAPAQEPGRDEDLEIDEDFLRKIRDA